MYFLKDINTDALSDPVALCARSEAHYTRQIDEVAAGIAEHMAKSRVALLCGPSSSGKTTTARRITEALAKRGISCHVISLDDYYMDVDENYPKNPDGSYDFESPYCLDIPLLTKHIHAIEQGLPVDIPRFDFMIRRRDSKTTHIPADGGIVLYEGIHALNATVMGDEIERAYGIYIRVGGEVWHEDLLQLPKNYVRLCRRIVRDSLFRNTDPAATLAMWNSVRAGEHKYILPGRALADYRIDSFHPCEPGLFRPLISEVLEGVDHPLADALRRAYAPFVNLTAEHLSADCLLREFIGNN